MDLTSFAFGNQMKKEKLNSDFFLKARAEAEALKAEQEEANDRTNITSSQGAGSIKGKQANSVSVSEMRAPRDGQSRSHEAFQFSASNNERLRENRPPKEARESSQHRAYKSQSMSWHERSLHRRSYQARERTRQDYERPSRPMREQVSHRYPLDPQAEAIIGKCQRESLRQGFHIPNTATPERISVSHRLSGIGLIQTSTVGKDRVTSASSNHERVPATHRLGPPPNPLLVLQDDLGSTQNMSSEERLPAIGLFNMDRYHHRLWQKQRPQIMKGENQGILRGKIRKQRTNHEVWRRPQKGGEFLN
ncbi:hypothetical protein YC2023_048802 [Brassica napus]